MKTKKEIQEWLPKNTISYEPHIPLVKLAKKWGKSTSELIIWIANGKMEAHFWYDGSIRQKFKGIYLPPSPLQGWVRPEGEDLLPLQGRKNVTLKHFLPISKDSHGKLVPATNIVISLDELVVMEKEVDRMECKNPELTKDQFHSHASELSEREILVSIVNVLATKGYGYDPDGKSITEEVIEDVDRQDLSIGKDAVLGNLRESLLLHTNKMNKTMHPTKRSGLLKMILGMAMGDAYNYNNSDKNIDKIIEDIKELGYLIDAKTLLSTLNSASALKKNSS